MAKSMHIFGVTGSIGQSARDVILAQPDLFDVHTVSAHRNVVKLAETARALNAKAAVIADQDCYDDLKQALSGSDIKIAAGAQALCDAAQVPVDLSLMAIVGIAGLRPLWAALDYSRAIAIANKEPLVAAGALVMEKAKAGGVQILPVDSEHNAIFQVFETQNRAQVKRIILTASGGAFRGWSAEQMKDATPDQALKHPNWSMGAKVTIDTATLMNKGLEVVEAHHLFAVPADRIDVLIHPQSVIHSMVEYSDGSVLSQMGASDMRTPIANALGWPARINTPGACLDLAAMGQLTFEAPDHQRFPALKLAYDCLKAGPAACIVMNAANEMLVEAFLNKQIGFLDIAARTAYFTENSLYQAPTSLDDVESIDQDVRARVKEDIVK